MWRCHQLLSGFLVKSHLLRASHQSNRSDNDKGDSEMIPRTVHRSPGINLPADENPGKPQLGDRLMKAVRPVIASDGVSYFQMRSVGSHSRSGRE